MDTLYANKNEYIIDEEEINKNRPKPFLFLTVRDKNEYTNEKVLDCLKDLKECGYGGFILFNKPPLGFDKDSYLSDEWFDVVEKFAVNSIKLGLIMWINDGFDCPPGDVGGKIHDIDPTLCQKRIMLENEKLVVKNVEWRFPAY